MNSKITPGPWRFYEDKGYTPPAPELVGMPGRGDKDRRFLIDGAAPGKESFIGEVISCYGEADAQAIAAVPELIEALEDLLKVHAKALAEFECGEVWQFATRKHRAALAKAKGES